MTCADRRPGQASHSTVSSTAVITITAQAASTTSRVAGDGPHTAGPPPRRPPQRRAIRASVRPAPTTRPDPRRTRRRPAPPAARRARLRAGRTTRAAAAPARVLTARGEPTAPAPLRRPGPRGSCVACRTCRTGAQVRGGKSASAVAARGELIGGRGELSRRLLGLPRRARRARRRRAARRPPRHWADGAVPPACTGGARCARWRRRRARAPARTWPPVGGGAPPRLVVDDHQLRPAVGRCGRPAPRRRSGRSRPTPTAPARPVRRPGRIRPAA